MGRDFYTKGIGYLRKIAGLEVKKLENIIIPNNFEYKSIKGLSNESLEKLILIRPETLGQASSLAGVRPSDISVLAVYIKS